MTIEEYKDFLYTNAANHIINVSNATKNESISEGFNAFQISDILSVVFCETNDSVTSKLIQKVIELKQRKKQL